jgi:lysozyme
MKTSQAGIELIKRHEGCRLTVYKDAAGLPTIGVGHLIRPGERFTDLTETEAEDLLRDDLAEAEDHVSELLTRKVSQGSFDALVSFCFNVGRNALAKSTLLKRVNEGADLLVPAELVRWINAGGKPLKGLLRRRLDEARLYLSDG